MDKEIINIMWLMLSKLNRMDKIGGAHTEIINLYKGLPLHLRSSNQGKKKIQKAVKELIKREFLLQKPSTGELHISINPRKLKEIIEFIENNKS
jgi:hypothetical protein